MRNHFPKRTSGAPLHPLSKFYDVPVGFVSQLFRQCIAIFAVSEGWLLLDIEWFVLFVYDVTQVLCKMATLKTGKLLFVTYSEKSTSVLEATFDEELWCMICEVVCDVYGTYRHIPERD